MSPSSSSTIDEYPAEDTIWFDDARSLKPKYKLAKDHGLLGVGMWKADSLSYDDKYAAERSAMWGAIAKWNA